MAPAQSDQKSTGSADQNQGKAQHSTIKIDGENDLEASKNDQDDDASALSTPVIDEAPANKIKTDKNDVKDNHKTVSKADNRYLNLQ